MCSVTLGSFHSAEIQMLIMINDLTKTKIYPKFHIERIKF